MTTFKAALGLCGLSQAEAAEYLGVSLGTIKKWSSGTGAPPFGVWVMVADLWAQILDAGESAAEKIDPENMDRGILNGVCADDPHDPLPRGADVAAGAVAVLSSISDRNL